MAFIRALPSRFSAELDFITVAYIYNIIILYRRIISATEQMCGTYVGRHRWLRRNFYSTFSSGGERYNNNSNNNTKHIIGTAPRPNNKYT